MRIDTTKTYDGVPALRVRDLLRKISHLNQHSWTPEELAEMSKTSPDDPAAFAATLLAEELLEHVSTTAETPWWAMWTPGQLVITERGVAFGNAKAGSVKRATAEKALAGLLTRAAEINADEAATHHVREIVLFGSYLHGAEDTVGDLDVAVDLVRVRKSEAGSIGEMFAESTKVLRRLRGRSRTISIVDLEDHRDWLADKPHQQVFFDAGVLSLRNAAA